MTTYSAATVATGQRFVVKGWRSVGGSARGTRLRNVTKGARPATSHASSQVERLQERTSALTGRETSELLNRIATDFGMSWVDVAAVAGVSVPALRKWRMGRSATAENHRAVAKLLALLEMLRNELNRANTVTWLLSPSLDDYTVRPLDAYLAGQDAALLEFAGDNLAIGQFLDAAVPDWRTTKRHFDTVYLEDGQPALVLRRD